MAKTYLLKTFLSLGSHHRMQVMVAVGTNNSHVRIHISEYLKCYRTARKNCYTCNKSRTIPKTDNPSLT